MTRLPERNLPRSGSGTLFFTFFYLYALQGVPAGFALTTLMNYLIGQGLSSSTVASFGALVGLPWLFQFIWGPFIDKYKYRFGGSQKIWVMITQFLAITASIVVCLVSDPITQISFLTFAFFLHSVFASIQDASVDALAITSMNSSERGRLNAFMRGGFLIGISFGAVGLSLVLHAYGFMWAAICHSLFLMTGILVTSMVRFRAKNGDEPGPAHHSSTPPIRILFAKLIKHFTEKSSLRFILLLGLIFSSFSIFRYSITYYVLADLHMPDKKLSVMQGSWGTAITFLVIMGCGQLADTIGPKKLTRLVVWGTGLFIILFSVISLLQMESSFVIGGLLMWNFADPIMCIAVFPVLMSMSAKHIEGSLFTCYMAFINFNDVLGNTISGGLLERVDGRLIALFAGVTLLCITRLLKNQPILNSYPAPTRVVTEKPAYQNAAT